MARFEGEPTVPPDISKYITSAASLALVFAIAGYVESLDRPTPRSNDTGINLYHSIIPNMRHFLALDSKDKCSGGGARPCAMLIRSQPYLESPYVNAKPGQRRVNWPLESYKGRPGHDVVVDCHQTGQMVHALDGSSSSSTWYRVIVPPQHVKNEQLSRDMNAGTIRTVEYAGQTALYAWAAAEWFGQTEPDHAVKPC